MPKTACAAPPNIVFILADDLGWSDVGCFGSRYYKTPNIDALARRGMMFTQAYAANPLCSPTRASILSGQYPARLGLTAPVGHLPEVRLKAAITPRAAPDKKCLDAVSVTRFDTNLVTLAETLKGAGYATGHFGKWHLGAEPYSPLQQGFDVDVPHWPGPGPAGSYVAPWKFPAKLNFSGAPGEHIEDRMAAEAAKFIAQHKKEPFFLNYWAFSVHAPYDAKRELVDLHRADADEKAPQHNPLYAAMVHSLDDAVGTLIKALDDNGLSQNTLVVFFSDNGGVNWQAMKNEGAGELARTFAKVPPTNNAPLRGGKASIYEGGTREPCIVAWPGTVKASSRSNAPIQSIDFYPTLAQIAGAKMPAGQTVDGRSFWPVLNGESDKHRDAIFNFFPHHIAVNGQVPAVSVRRQNWKLIRFLHDGPTQENRFELYNLQDDLGETKNLADAQPNMVKDLDALIDGFLRDTNALVPGPNPNFGKTIATTGEAPQNALADWTSSANARLKVENGQLLIESVGGDPFLWTRDVPPQSGPVTMEISLSSTGKGAGEIRWTTKTKPNFGRELLATFDIVHDGALHTYSVPLPATEPLLALRIDPGAAPGSIRLAALRLKDAQGALVKEWMFK